MPKEEFVISSDKLDEVVKSSMTEFAHASFVDRYPDIDGLKPVMRRVLYMMKHLGLTDKTSTMKCAQIVGAVIGQLHPHGDVGVYNALVATAQAFTLNYPLIDGQGNFGNQLGDPPSAYRYTECRFSPYGYQCFIRDLNDESVEFVPTFDSKWKEPTILPTSLPNLIINGNYTIGAAAFNSSIPPHNLAEVIDITIALIKDPTISNEVIGSQLLPDFPFGGILINPEEVQEYYKHGTQCAVKMIAKYEIDTTQHRIHIYELPYLVDGNTLKQEIQRKFPKLKEIGIKDIIPDCTDTTMDFVIEYDKNANPEKLVGMLMSKTRMSASSQLMFTCTMYGKLRENITLKDMFTEWIYFRRKVVRKGIMHTIQKNYREAHILEALINSFEKLDDIIMMIRKAHDKDEVVYRLINQYHFTVLQATAISNMKLHEISKKSKHDLVERHTELKQEMKKLRTQLLPATIDFMIMGELTGLKVKYGRPRKTQIIRQTAVPVQVNVNHDYIISPLSNSKDINIIRLDALTSGGSKRMNNLGKVRKILSAYKYNPHTDYLCAISNYGYFYKIQDIVDYISASTLDITTWKPVTVDISPRIGEAIVDYVVIPKIFFETGLGHIIIYSSDYMIRKYPTSQIPQRISKTGYQLIKFKETATQVTRGKFITKSDTLIGYGNELGQVHVYPLETLPSATRLSFGTKMSPSQTDMQYPSLLDKNGTYYIVATGGKLITGKVEDIPIRKAGSTPAILHKAGKKQRDMLSMQFGGMPANGLLLLSPEGNASYNRDSPGGCVAVVEL